MAKKQTKITKEETLETILFNCRNSLGGRAAMTDKRDFLFSAMGVPLRKTGNEWHSMKRQFSCVGKG